MNARSKTIGIGALTGLLAALAMTLALLLFRFCLGLATPSEFVIDRIGPLLSVRTFIQLLDRFGGYNNLKQIGVISVIGGQLFIGVLDGVGYAVARERGLHQNQRNNGPWLLAVFVGFLWVASIILLWPVLGTSPSGLPPGKGMLVNGVSLLLAYAVYFSSLLWLFGTIFAPHSSDEAGLENPTGRRTILIGALGALGVLTVGFTLKALYKLATFSYDGTRYKGSDVQAITPNDRFYVVTKNVIDPDVRRSFWRLDITGLVERPTVYRFEDLLVLPAVTQETTLRCISNQVGDGLMSNAMWKGVTLRSLIEKASPKSGVVEVRLHGVDNYTDTFAFAKALEPTTIVAYEMNGQALPVRHGFPARAIVPGLFGEKHVKWITRVELVDHDAKGFYEQQGWGPNFEVPTTARIDVPWDGQEIKLSGSERIELRGVAHAGDRGVSKVEVSADDGHTWNQANIADARSPLAWVLWNYDWQPDHIGDYKLVVRATDNEGATQTAEQRDTVPQGATGYHRITTHILA